jgi:uncharacterized protein involved in exopolysaccharide biosynthesis
MTRDLDAARAQLQALLDRMQQTTQQSAIESSEAHEISLAIAPEHPSSPRAVQTMVAFSAAGVFLGLCWSTSCNSRTARCTAATNSGN